jgi:hypothetical protein
VIRFFFNDLRTSIDRSTTFSQSQERRVNSPSEIAYFDSIFMKENVFRLDISMNDIELMKVF